jgi:hypothetical protein
MEKAWIPPILSFASVPLLVDYCTVRGSEPVKGYSWDGKCIALTRGYDLCPVLSFPGPTQNGTEEVVLPDMDIVFVEYLRVSRTQPYEGDKDKSS